MILNLGFVMRYAFKLSLNTRMMNNRTTRNAKITYNNPCRIASIPKNGIKSLKMDAMRNAHD